MSQQQATRSQKSNGGESAAPGDVSDDPIIESPEVQWLNELRCFAGEMKQHQRSDHQITSEARFGIGPVQYDIYFDGTDSIAEEKTKLLDKLVRLEQLFGDRTIKFEASLLFAIFGTEQPISWLPAAQRLRIRRAGRAMTAKRIERLNLVQKKVTPCDVLTEYIRACDKLPNAANPAEIAIVAATAPRDEDDQQGDEEAELLYPWLTPENIAKILETRRRRMDYDRNNQAFISRLIRTGIMEKLTVQRGNIGYPRNTGGHSDGEDNEQVDAVDNE